LDFYREKKYRTSINQDYVKNEYDKGHMMPYEAVSCDSIIARSSFSYLNCAMQHEKLNRNVWRMLELIEKRLGEHNTIYVEIHILFENKNFTKSGTQIPSKFIKKIWINGVLKRQYGFLNIAPKSNNLKDYEIH
jgi:DNA/RNA endonuclease G (NUC1)